MDTGTIPQKDTATANICGTSAPAQPSDPKAVHEATEAMRKAEWDAKQAIKKAAEGKVMEEMQSMSNEDVAAAAVKSLGDDTERLTRRNMKICVTEHVQALCQTDPAFARKAMHPRKNMINCFKFINEKAIAYVKRELELRGEKAVGEVAEDVPDDLCYQWAVDYFNDPDAEVDKDKEDKFVPKTYCGGSSSKAKKKEPAKKPPAAPAKKPVEQLGFDFGGSE
jgi:hypothetical protein